MCCRLEAAKVQYSIALRIDCSLPHPASLLVAVEPDRRRPIFIDQAPKAIDHDGIIPSWLLRLVALRFHRDGFIPGGFLRLVALRFRRFDPDTQAELARPFMRDSGDCRYLAPSTRAMLDCFTHSCLG